MESGTAFSFGALFNDPNKMNELAMTANPFPILNEMGKAPSAPYASNIGAFGQAIGAPSVNAAPQSQPGPAGAAPLSPQQMAALNNMTKAPDARFAPSAGTGGRPGQVNLQPIAPGSPNTKRPMSLSQILGTR